MKTPRGRVYLLASEKRVLTELFHRLNLAGAPGAWSADGRLPGRPPAGTCMMAVRLTLEMADRVRANAALRRITPAEYLGDIVAKNIGGRN